MGTSQSVSIDERQMNPDSERLSGKVVFASMVGVWLCYFLLITLRGVVVGLEFQDELLWRRALVCIIGVAVTGLLWLILRVVEDRSLGIKIAVTLSAAMPGAMMIAQANRWIFDSIEEKIEQEMGKERGIALRRDDAGNLLIDLPRAQIGEDVEQAEEAVPQSVLIAPAPTSLDQWKMTFDLAIGRYFLLLAWAALFLALLAGAQARAAERRCERFRSAAKAAELRSLRYQVNPHFLFNTLNSLSSLVMKDRRDEAEQMIMSLSNFYRTSLTGDPLDDVPLAEEVHLQKLYLDIEAVRFPDRLKTVIDIPPALLNACVPGLILQPVVENAIKYGVSRTAQPVEIRITAREDGDLMHINVTDDGPNPPGRGDGGSGIGLANVRDRLTARFGDRGRIVYGPRDAGGFAVLLTLPIIRRGC